MLLIITKFLNNEALLWWNEIKFLYFCNIFLKFQLYIDELNKIKFIKKNLKLNIIIFCLNIEIKNWKSNIINKIN